MVRTKEGRVADGGTVSQLIVASCCSRCTRNWILTLWSGSLQECFFELMTFGIPVQVFPISVSGENQFEHHKMWVKQLRNSDQARVEWDNQKRQRCIVPGPKDVLFGREKLSRSHAGNVHYYHIIARRQEQYDNAQSIDERSIVASDIVLSVKESGGILTKE